jgi:hypothetical protein
MRTINKSGQEHYPGAEKGFILIVVLFILLFLAVTALSLNSRGGMRVRMASNQSASLRVSLGQMAALEEGLWQLTKDPLWWNSAGSKDYVYDGNTYTRTAQTSPLSDYTDTVVVSVTAPGGAKALRASFRYYIREPVSGTTIDKAVHQGFHDGMGNIYFAVPDKHRIYKRAITGEITTVAGTGSSDYSGDGGPATLASLQSPYGVFVEAGTGGHLYRRYGE